MIELATTRESIAQRGIRLEYFTIAWNSLEGLVAVVAGRIAGSISLVGFGSGRVTIAQSVGHVNLTQAELNQGAQETAAVKASGKR